MREWMKRKGLVKSLGLFCLWALSFVVMAEGVPLAKKVKPDLVLLKEFNQTTDVKGWLMSEKLDGVRAYWNGKQLMSRNGHLFVVPRWFIKSFPPFELDGELWIGRQSFEKVVSIVRRKQPHDGWKEITFQVFDVPNQNGGLMARLRVLDRYLENNPTTYIKVLDQVPIVEQQDVRKRLDYVHAKGGEGLVLRDPNVDYYSGRTAQSVKVKLKQDAECIVTGYTAGKGKYLDMVGALKCRIAKRAYSKQKLDDFEIKIGSGLTDVMRREPPKIGSVVTFQYMGLTAKGLPKFPVYLRDREDFHLSK